MKGLLPREENGGIWSRHTFLMFLSCAIPLGLIALFSFLHVVGPWGFYALILLCPLLHFFLMRQTASRPTNRGPS